MANAVPLTPAIRDVIQQTIRQLLDDLPPLFGDLHDAVAASAPDSLVTDPALAAEIERSNVAILAAWLQANVDFPGEPVEPVLEAETLDIIRDVARRGLEDSTYNYFRVGLGVAAQHVLQASFSVSNDPALLRDALAIMLGSAADYIDRSVAALRAVVEHERLARATGGRTRRLDAVTDLLSPEHAGSTASAGARLGFELAQPLVACILWTDPSTGVGTDALTELVVAVAAASQTRPPLVAAASAASVWAWLPTPRAPDVDLVRGISARRPGVRVAMGSIGSGIEGFRRSHFEALQTQRVMHRMGSALNVATHEDVRVVALAGADETAASEFISLTLGPLATAPPELRSTLRAVASAGHDSVRVAADLGLHRNTVLARIRRAKALLPQGYDRRWIDVSLALELDRWLRGDHDDQAPARAIAD